MPEHSFARSFPHMLPRILKFTTGGLRCNYQKPKEHDGPPADKPSFTSTAQASANISRVADQVTQVTEEFQVLVSCGPVPARMATTDATMVPAQSKSEIIALTKRIEPAGRQFAKDEFATVRADL